MAHTFKILGTFLTYPEEVLRREAAPLYDFLKTEGLVSASGIKTLRPFVHRLTSTPLMELQEDYVDLFDRSRSLSLHLFEHIHGESRDRGQAMVDLMTLYEQRGLKLDARELPDFLPLFLEFLSTIEADEARAFLGETTHVLEALRDRLAKRKSDYARIFTALIDLADESRNAVEEIQTADEDPDDLEALDRRWAEEPVTFGPGEEGCPIAQNMLDRMAPSDVRNLQKGDL